MEDLTGHLIVALLFTTERRDAGSRAAEGLAPPSASLRFLPPAPPARFHLSSSSLSLPRCQSEFHFGSYVNITVSEVEKVH